MRLAAALLGSMMMSCSASAFAAGWSDLWLNPEQRAQQLLDSGHAAQAAPLFSDPRRRAYADLRAGRYTQAAHLLAPFGDTESQYNRGNALARSGDLRGALAAYDEVLKRAPNDRDARHNRDLVAQALNKSPSSSTQQGQNHGAQGKSPHGTGSQGKGSGGKDSEAKSAGPDGSHGKSPQSRGAEPNSSQGPGPQQKDSGGNTASHPPGSSQPKGNQPGTVQPSSGAEPGGKSSGSADSPTQSPARADNDTGAQGSASRAAKPETEQALALDQWLRRIPDDPGGLLRRKFLIEHMLRQQGGSQ